LFSKISKEILLTQFDGGVIVSAAYFERGIRIPNHTQFGPRTFHISTHSTHIAQPYNCRFNPASFCLLWYKVLCLGWGYPYPYRGRLVVLLRRDHEIGGGGSASIKPLSSFEPYEAPAIFHHV
jgi:hypothetical protein